MNSISLGRYIVENVRKNPFFDNPNARENSLVPYGLGGSPSISINRFDTQLKWLNWLELRLTALPIVEDNRTRKMECRIDHIQLVTTVDIKKSIVAKITRTTIKSKFVYHLHGYGYDAILGKIESSKQLQLELDIPYRLSWHRLSVGNKQK